MPTYNLAEISDFEFEALCRDLLQAELGVSLELFTPGSDGGIDIRYIGSKEDRKYISIGQCKHWAEDSFNKLLTHLSKEELPKINDLAPDRYILMTSVKLTPGRKDKIVAALKPWIQSPSDVLGKDDISGLLVRHAEVERRHIKLWLTSTEVLDSLLNSGIWNRSESALEQAKRDIRLWVHNPSYARAVETLEDNHVCVISGTPGIGKTMLANVLSVGYASKGYEIIAISEDIDEGDRAWRSQIPQVFLYDDFLGQVTYGELHLRKNEESRLASFLDRVRNSKNKRFILTTREYILSEAQNRYERLSDIDFAASKNIIKLEDYTPFIRAHILYNHLFFSNLPYSLQTALLPGARYREVIRHHNYNPRVIAHAIDLPGVDSLSPDEFVSNIFYTLNNPTQVWERIFNNLPEMACRILRVLASLPSEVLLEDVQQAVKSISLVDFAPNEFQNALRMIEGTFVNLKEAYPGANNRDRVVAIRDPSVRDYLWARLEAVDGEADTLLDGAIFFEQSVILYEGRNHLNSMRTMLLSPSPLQTRKWEVVNHGVVATRAVELIKSPSPMLHIGIEEGAEYIVRNSISLERRAAFLIAILALHQDSHAVTTSANAAFEATVEEWESGHCALNDALNLLKYATRVEGSLTKDLLERAGCVLLKLITRQLTSREDFESLLALHSVMPDLFTEPRHALHFWKDDFEEFLYWEESWLLEHIDDPDELEEEISAISEIAAEFGLDIFKLEADAESRIEELRADVDPPDDEYLMDLYMDSLDEADGNSSAPGDIDRIDALFQSLR